MNPMATSFTWASTSWVLGQTHHAEAQENAAEDQAQEQGQRQGRKGSEEGFHLC
jgi:hypothetical protein